MQKTNYFSGVRFKPGVVRQAHDLFLSLISSDGIPAPQTMRVDNGLESWTFDSREEFLAYALDADGFRFDHIASPERARLIVQVDKFNQSFVQVDFPGRENIVAVFNVFESHVDNSRVIESDQPIKVFIGHGRNPQWRDLKDHLQDLHGFEVVAYEIGPRAGLSVKEVLENMLSKSSFALLLLTGEDEQTDGTLHARQNVIHELGLFQGRLGFTRAIAVLEEGVDEFSNIFGVNQIRFSRGMIRETYGDIIATIRREFEKR
jgi:predicted nucleotide-binding protein